MIRLSNGGIIIKDLHKNYFMMMSFAKRSVRQIFIGGHGAFPMEER